MYFRGTASHTLWIFLRQCSCTFVCVQTQKVYTWLPPKLCIGGVSLPVPGPLMPCSPCNPGQQLVNGVCEFCPLRQYSDGVTPCTNCPGSSAPQTAVVYQFWDSLPSGSNLTSFCLPGYGLSFHYYYVSCVVSDVALLLRLGNIQTLLLRRLELEQILVLDRIGAGLFLKIGTGSTVPVISVCSMSALTLARHYQCG